MKKNQTFEEAIEELIKKRNIIKTNDAQYYILGAKDYARLIYEMIMRG